MGPVYVATTGGPSLVSGGERKTVPAVGRRSRKNVVLPRLPLCREYAAPFGSRDASEICFFERSTRVELGRRGDTA